MPFISVLAMLGMVTSAGVSECWLFRNKNICFNCSDSLCLNPNSASDAFWAQIQVAGANRHQIISQSRVKAQSMVAIDSFLGSDDQLKHNLAKAEGALWFCCFPISDIVNLSVTMMRALLVLANVLGARFAAQSDLSTSLSGASDVPHNICLLGIQVLGALWFDENVSVRCSTQSQSKWELDIWQRRNKQSHVSPLSCVITFNQCQKTIEFPQKTHTCSLKPITDKIYLIHHTSSSHRMAKQLSWRCANTHQREDKPQPIKKLEYFC